MFQVVLYATWNPEITYLSSSETYIEYDTT